MKPFSRPFHINGNSFFQLGCTSNKRWQYFSINIPVEYIDINKPLVSNQIIMLLTDFTEKLVNFSEFTKSLSQVGNFVVEFDIAKATSDFVMESGVISKEVKNIINERFGNELIRITDNLIDVINDTSDKQEETVSKLSEEFDEFLLDIGLDIISIFEEKPSKATVALASTKLANINTMEFAKKTKFTYFKEEKNNIYDLTLIHPNFLALHAADTEYLEKYNHVTHFFEELIIDIKKYCDQKDIRDLNLDMVVKFNATINDITIDMLELNNTNEDSVDKCEPVVSHLFNELCKYFDTTKKRKPYTEFIREFNKNAINFTNSLKNEIAKESFRKMVIKVAFVDGITQLTFTEKENTENSAVISFGNNILPNDRLIKLCNAVEEKTSYELIEMLGISKTTTVAVTRFIESSNKIDASYAKALLQLMAFH
jgi:hypothetical protein